MYILYIYIMYIHRQVYVQDVDVRLDVLLLRIILREMQMTICLCLKIIPLYLSMPFHAEKQGRKHAIQICVRFAGVVPDGS